MIEKKESNRIGDEIESMEVRKKTKEIERGLISMLVYRESKK